VPSMTLARILYYRKRTLGRYNTYARTHVLTITHHASALSLSLSLSLSPLSLSVSLSFSLSVEAHNSIVGANPLFARISGEQLIGIFELSVRPALGGLHMAHPFS